MSPHCLLTHLASFFPNPQVCRGWAWLAKAVPQKNASLYVTHPPPQGQTQGATAWYQLVARNLGCVLQPSLTEASLSFQAAIACRQAKFCPKFDSVFINSDLNIYLTISSICTKTCLDILFVDIKKRTVFRERVYCPTNIFRNTRDLKIGKITQFSKGIF